MNFIIVVVVKGFHKVCVLLCCVLLFIWCFFSGVFSGVFLLLLFLWTDYRGVFFSPLSSHFKINNLKNNKFSYFFFCFLFLFFLLFIFFIVFIDFFKNNAFIHLDHSYEVWRTLSLSRFEYCPIKWYLLKLFNIIISYKILFDSTFTCVLWYTVDNEMIIIHLCPYALSDLLCLAIPCINYVTNMNCDSLTCFIVKAPPSPPTLDFSNCSIEIRGLF